MAVEFEENNVSSNYFKSRTVLGLPQTPKMVQFLINKKIIKNEKTAGNFLLVLSIVSFILAIFIVYVLSRPEQVEYNLSPKVIKSLPTEIKQKIYESQKK